MTWDWWGNTDSDRDELIRVLEWLNQIEAEKAKSKFVTYCSKQIGIDWAERGISLGRKFKKGEVRQTAV